MYRTSIPRPAETNVWNVKSEKCVDFSSGIFPTLTSAVYPYPGHVSCPTISVIFGLFSILVLHFPFSLVANISTLIFLIAPFSPWPPHRSFLMSLSQFPHSFFKFLICAFLISRHTVSFHPICLPFRPACPHRFVFIFIAKT